MNDVERAIAVGLAFYAAILVDHMLGRLKSRWRRKQ
jgi:hypothetical protein